MPTYTALVWRFIAAFLFLCAVGLGVGLESQVVGSVLGERLTTSALTAWIILVFAVGGAMVLFGPVLERKFRRTHAGD
jgi:hypothetical protein